MLTVACQVTRIKYVNSIRLGIYEMDTWYFSPYPEEYGRVAKLFICEWCLKYMQYAHTLDAHQCTARQVRPVRENNPTREGQSQNPSHIRRIRVPQTVADGKFDGEYDDDLARVGLLS